MTGCVLSVRHGAHFAKAERQGVLCVHMECPQSLRSVCFVHCPANALLDCQGYCTLRAAVIAGCCLHAMGRSVAKSSAGCQKVVSLASDYAGSICHISRSCTGDALQHRAAKLFCHVSTACVGSHLGLLAVPLRQCLSCVLHVKDEVHLIHIVSVAGSLGCSIWHTM